MSKFCKFCEIEHPATAEFWIMGRGKVSRCKIQKKAYNAANAEVISRNKKFYQKSNAVAIAANKKVYYTSNITTLKMYQQAYQKSNAVKIATQQKEYQKGYRKANSASVKVRQLDYRKKNAARQKTRRQNDQQYRLSSNLRTRLGEAIRHKSKKGSAVRDLGCSIEFLESYLQARFTSEMTWANYGTVWTIDHIYPLARVDLEDRAQFIKACNYRNLQPMLARDNLAKSDSVTMAVEQWFRDLEV